MTKIERIEQIEKELAELKRQVKAEQEIKPVFPLYQRYEGSSDYVHVGDKNAQDYGLTADGGTGALNIAKWLRARARIIERINIVNKGNNGFKARTENWLLENDTYDNGGVSAFVYCGTQSTEPRFYIRTKEAAKELLNNPDHIADMKVYMSIGSE